jgi:tetratricopeptide (TPR) repeat protein
LRAWFSDDFQAGAVRKGLLIRQAREGDWSARDGMLRSLVEDREDERHVAGLARLLGACPDAAKVAPLAALLDHPSPWVRAAAVSALSDRWESEARSALAAALGDASRLVRIEAAAAGAGVPRALWGEDILKAFEGASGEFVAAMELRGSDPDARERLGHFWLSQGELVRAATLFEQLLADGVETVSLRISAATARWKMADAPAAEVHLRAALALGPDSVAAWYNWIVFLERSGRSGDAVTARVRARAALKGRAGEELGRRLDAFGASNL